MEWICSLTAVMACAKHGHSFGILLHPLERHMSRNLDAGFGWAGKIQGFFWQIHIANADSKIGAIMVIL